MHALGPIVATGIHSIVNTYPARPWYSATTTAVPAVALLALVGIYATHSNQSIFLTVNRLSSFTGDALWAHATVIGDALVAAVLTLCFVGRRPDIVCSLFIGGLLAASMVPGIKEMLDVPRPPFVLAPELFHVIGPPHKTDAFPSGHTTTAFVVAGVLTMHLENRIVVTTLVILAACTVGLSRLVVGVHWPADVCAGAIIGWLCAAVGTYLARRWAWGQRRLFQALLASILIAAAVYLLTVYRNGYDQTVWLQRIIAIASIAAGSTGLYRMMARPPLKPGGPDRRSNLT